MVSGYSPGKGAREPIFVPEVVPSAGPLPDLPGCTEVFWASNELPHCLSDLGQLCVTGFW